MPVEIDCTVDLSPAPIEVTLLPSSSIDVALFGPNQIDVNYGHVGAQGPPGLAGESIVLKGSVPTAANLPTTGNTQGDLWIAADTGHGWVWSVSPPGWTDVGKIQGPAGPAGPQGLQGNPGPQGLQGLTGATGPAGSTGPQGPLGNPGPQGSQGLTGATGPVGPIGSQGPIGATGPAGPVGAKGDQGTQGNQGVSGPAGPQGLTGAIGATGATGNAGPQGATGPQGSTGTQGATGAIGPQGATGPQGSTGTQGATGAIGPQGATGPQGPVGAQGVAGPVGAQGPAGPQGPVGAALVIKGTVSTAANLPTTGNTNGDLWIAADTGHGWAWQTNAWVDVGPVQGPRGATGATGPTGPAGPTGATGSQGPAGPQGTTGATGATGIQGPVGPPGATGTQGTQGPTGATGAQGPQGVPGPAGTAGQGYTWRGTWVNTTAYSPYDTVSRAGSSYVCILASTGNDPSTDATHWNIIAQIGATGAAGTTGSQGPAGATGPTGSTGPTGPQGPTGAAGSTGPQGATGSQGPVGPTGQGYSWKGAWSASTAYLPYDTVSRTGSSYVCTSGNTGNDPAIDTTHWSLIAQVGAIGPSGATGSQGPTGPPGATGATGPTGATGSQGPAGPVGMTWRGAWAGATAYAVNDVVSQAGSSYICILANTGNTPPNATYWSLVAQIGATGATGSQGPTGATGATGATGPQGSTGATGPQGPAGPSAVSTDAGNIATLGSDSLILVPQSQIWSARLRSFNAVGNPNFSCDQRTCFTNTTSVANGTFACDRWLIGKSAATGTANSVWNNYSFGGAATVPGTNFAIGDHAYGLVVGTVQASPAAGDYFQLYQTVEGSVFRELSQDIYSVSILAWCAAALKFGITIKDPTGTRTLTKLCSIPASSWTLVQLPNLPVFPTAGAFSIAPGVAGYLISISLGAGTTYTAPANDTWQSGNYMAAAGQDWFLGKPSGTIFYVAFLQHEPGQCTTLIDKPFAAQNLDECLRYYQKSYSYGTKPGTATGSQTGVVAYQALVNNHPIAPFNWKKIMAKAPTLTAYSGSTGAANNVRNETSSIDLSTSGVAGASDAGFNGFYINSPPASAWLFSYQYTADTGW